MNDYDFETVRQGLNWKGSGSETPARRAALDRIEAELRNERHRARVASTECAALHERLRDREAEVERLTAWKDAAESGGGAGVRAARAEAEVARLRTRNEYLESEAYVDNYDAIVEENERFKAEVERLRAQAWEHGVDEVPKLRKEVERLREHLEREQGLTKWAADAAAAGQANLEATQEELRLQDIEQERLREAGIEVGIVFELQGEMRLLDVYDPDGNRIQLAQEL